MKRSLTKIKDVDLKILSKLDDEDLFNFCVSHKYGRKLSLNEHFWRNRLVKKHGEDAVNYKNSSRTWKDYYLKIFECYDEDFSANTAMFNAAKRGHKDLVDFFISKGAINWNEGMKQAAKGGHKDLVELFISKGADDWNWGMASAAKGGHIDLVDFFISKGAYNLNYGMYGAAGGGHKDLVDFFISKGANDWYRAILYADAGGHQDLVEFLESKKENDCDKPKIERFCSTIFVVMILIVVINRIFK